MADHRGPFRNQHRASELSRFDGYFAGVGGDLERCKRGIVMENSEYPNKETAEKKLKAMIRSENWFPVLGVEFDH